MVDRDDFADRTAWFLAEHTELHRPRDVHFTVEYIDDGPHVTCSVCGDSPDLAAGQAWDVEPGT